MAFKGGNEQEQVQNAKQVLFDAEVKVKELAGLCQKAETDLAFLENEIKEKSAVSEQLKKDCESLSVEKDLLAAEVKSAEKSRASVLAAFKAEVDKALADSGKVQADLAALKEKFEVEKNEELSALNKLSAEVLDLSAKCDALNSEAKVLTAEVAELEEKKVPLAAEVKELEAKRDAAVAGVKDAEASIVAAEVSKAKILEELASATVQLEQVSAWAEEVKKKATDEIAADRAKFDAEVASVRAELDAERESNAKRSAWNEAEKKRLAAIKEKDERKSWQETV